MAAIGASVAALDTTPTPPNRKRTQSPPKAGEAKKIKQPLAMMAGKTPKSALHEYFQLQGGTPTFSTEQVPGATETPCFNCRWELIVCSRYSAASSARCEWNCE